MDVLYSSFANANACMHMPFSRLFYIFPSACTKLSLPSHQIAVHQYVSRIYVIVCVFLVFPNLLQGCHRWLQLLSFGQLLLPSATQSTEVGQLPSACPQGPSRQCNGTFVELILPSLITKRPWQTGTTPTTHTPSHHPIFRAFVSFFFKQCLYNHAASMKTIRKNWVPSFYKHCSWIVFETWLTCHHASVLSQVNPKFVKSEMCFNVSNVWSLYIWRHLSTLTEIPKCIKDKLGWIHTKQSRPISHACA